MVELGDSEDSSLNTNLRQKLDNVGQGLSIRFYLSPQAFKSYYLLNSIFFPGGGGGGVIFLNFRISMFFCLQLFTFE